MPMLRQGGMCLLGLAGWMILITAPAYPENAGNCFNDAVAVWHMAETTDAAGANSALQVEGDVTLGVALSGSDRDASLQRGGDGRVAEFRGGYLSAGQGVNNELNISGTAMTLCLRVRLGTDIKDTPLFSKHGGHSALVYNVFCTDLGAGPAFGFELGTDAREKPLQLSAPVNRIGAETWHDLIARFSGAKLEWFVDGVLVDEEWPMGALRQGNNVPCLIGAETAGVEIKSGFHGWIDHAALWDRALTDAEIVSLSGGNETVAVRDREILGPEKANMQYWRPRGFNASVGDCMPFFHDGRFHVFYLFDRRHHGSKWGLGAHQWAHMSSTDLVHWEQHPMAIPITEPWEGSICTGSVFFHEGVYYAHYAVRMPDGKQQLAQAVSQDGIHFVKSPMFPLASPQEGYDPYHYRDPFVFEDAATGPFHMIVTARLTDGQDGCLAHLISPDLKTWMLTEPFIIPGRVTDCPDYFEWNGWRYLLAEYVYWHANNANGPWITPKPDRLDALYVPKTAPFTNGRRIYVSWLPDGGWGGQLVFRELIQREDGRLGTKFLPEMLPACGDVVKWTPDQTQTGITPADIAITAGPERQVVSGSAIPADARITLNINPSPGAHQFGVMLHAREQGAGGCELLFEPATGSMQLNAIEAGQEKKTICSLDEIDGLDKPFSLDLILKDDIVDVCVDNRQTMIGRYAGTGHQLAFFGQDARVDLHAITIRSILPDAEY